MSDTNVLLQTKLIHNRHKFDPTTGALSTAIQNATTFHQFDIEQFGEYDYARSDNPTRATLENIIAEIENGVAGFAFASGMAAISTALLLFSAGDHLVITEDVYGGTYRIVTEVLARLNIDHTFVDMTNLDAVRQAIQPNTKAFYIETPSNPTLKITNIQAISELAKEKDALTLVDNTFLTPLRQQPLNLGADIVLHSATKFLAGHSDVVSGLAVVKDSELAKKLKFLQNSFGSVLSPHDSWLVMRGIKTLHIRLKESENSAKTITQFLAKHPKIQKIYYPDVGAVLSFELEDYNELKSLVKYMKIPAFAVSLGGVESILSYPAKMSHAAMSKAEREKRGISDNLLRLSVGLEDVTDIINDFEQALQKI